jgi:hypothetical protein
LGFRKPFKNGFETNSDGVYIPGCDFHKLKRNIRNQTF